MDYAALIGAMIQAFGTMAGEQAAVGSDAAAKQAQAKALLELQNIQAPYLSPIEAQTLRPSEAGGPENPETYAAKQAVLSKLKEISDNGGMTLADQTNFNKLQNQVNQKDAAARGRILENMQARGTLGSGAELAASLNQQQAGAQRQAEAGADMAASAQANALKALMNRGQFAGQMSEEDLKRAQARDAINKYNTQAQERSKQYRQTAQQQNFENQKTAGVLRSGGYEKSAAASRFESDQARKLWGGIGASGGALRTNNANNSGVSGNNSGGGSNSDYGNVYEGENSGKYDDAENPPEE